MHGKIHNAITCESGSMIKSLLSNYHMVRIFKRFNFMDQYGHIHGLIFTDVSNLAIMCTYMYKGA